MSDMMTNIDSKTWRTARQALEKAIALYLNDPNVSHIDLGYRIGTSKGNQIEPELVVRVHVHQKLTGAEFEKFAALYPDRVIDAQKIGYPIDVIEASYSLQRSKTTADPAMVWDGGIVLSDKFNQSYGTLGGKVRDVESGKEMMLSTWHFLAATKNPDSELLLQQTGRQGSLTGQKLLAKSCRNALSASLDAAVAQFNEGIAVTNQQPGIGLVAGSGMPQLGLKIIKSGAGTGITKGIIRGILGYSIHQLDGEDYIIGPSFHVSSESGEQKICGAGDSGAWWLEQATLRAVGLHFAGDVNSQSALALSMPEVLQALGVEIVIEQQKDSISLADFFYSAKNKIVQRLKHSITSEGIKLFNFVSGLWMNSKAVIGQFVTKVKELIQNFIRSFDLNLIYKQTLSFVKNNITRVYFKLVQICLIFFFGFLILKFNYYQIKIDKRQQGQIDDLYKNLILIKNISQIEWERFNDVKKIVNIIDQFNHEMEYELKLTIANEIYQMSKRYNNLDIELICATITHETALTWNPTIVSPKNAIGLMQIIPPTGCLLAKEEGLEFDKIETILFDPILNINLGCRYLSKLVGAYSLDGGLAAYNGGMKRAETWLRNGRAKGILHEETDKYVPSILKIYQEFRRL